MIDTDDLPYIDCADDLTAAVAGLANELLWRITGYDERPPTAGDVAAVLAGIAAGREQFLERALAQLDDGRHLRVVSA